MPGTAPATAAELPLVLLRSRPRARPVEELRHYPCVDLVVVLGVGEEFVRHGLEASEELLLRPATAFAARRCSLLLLLCATATHVPPRAVGRRCSPRRRLLLLSCTTAACVSQHATGRRLMIKSVKL